jgi:hypothetical protein
MSEWEQEGQGGATEGTDDELGGGSEGGSEGEGGMAGGSEGGSEGDTDDQGSGGGM